MPSNKNTQAAVPYVNQKGERSMKRVRVERYVAGKKPSYAKDEDEDEYYTTDDEDGDQIDDEEIEGEGLNEEDGGEDDEKVAEEAIEESAGAGEIDVGEGREEDGNDEEEEDEDPRFRILREIGSGTRSTPILPPLKKEENVILIDEDEDEDEARERHRIARARKIEEPLQQQVAFGSASDDRHNNIIDSFHTKPRKEQTEDILKNFKLEGIKPKVNKERDEKAAEEKFKDMIENAKQQAIFQAQLHKKIEEDKKRELEREALSKGGASGKDMEAVNTDDEDEEIAYAEWQFREMKRILRDKSERESQETKVR